MSILRPRLRVVRQAETAECGLACVAMVAGAFGRDVDLSRLRHGHGASLRGMTLADVIACAEALGLAARPVRADLEAIGALRRPAILHWEMTHFVVLESVGRRGAVICDPARGRRRVSHDEMDRCFTGVAVEFMPTESFRQGRDRTPLRLSDLWSGLHGAVAAVGQLLVLTLLLQVFTLLAPLFVQITVDEVLVYGDADLLVTLAAAFAALAVFQAVTTVLHGLCTVAIGAAFDEQTNVNALTHLLRLPLAWFEQRHVGDVLSRVGALQPVTAFVSERLVAAFVDAAFAVVLVVILLAYDLRLAAVVLGSLGLVLALNLALFGRLRALTEETIARGARLESHLIETLRGMSALRMAGREGDRQRGWFNLFAAALDSRVRLQRLSLWVDGGAGLIGGLETVVVVWLAARATLDGDFTVGMLTAFLAYRTQTVARIGALIEHALELRMLRLHLERLADIAHATPEGTAVGRGVSAPRRLPGTGPLSVTVQELGFRYGPTQPWIFRRLDLYVEAGEWLALSGPSGCGKSTLLQVLMGQRAAIEGEVLVDGRRLDMFQLPAFRLAASAVQQDDNLFSGSIAENITFFDTTPDLERVHHCAALAAIDDEVLSMPMGFDTLIGDMGSALSGGQRQRVLLARALYRRPRLLLLDEATSQLDATCEASILAALRALPLTVVMIAHRAETLSKADRVFSLATPEKMSSAYLERP